MITQEHNQDLKLGGKHNQKKVSQVLILADQIMHTHHNIIFVDVF